MTATNKKIAIKESDLQMRSPDIFTYESAPRSLLQKRFHDASHVVGQCASVIFAVVLWLCLFLPFQNNLYNVTNSMNEEED